MTLKVNSALLWYSHVVIAPPSGYVIAKFKAIWSLYSIINRKLEKILPRIVLKLI